MMQAVRFLPFVASLLFGLYIAPQAIAVFAQSADEQKTGQSQFGHSVANTGRKKKKREKKEIQKLIASAPSMVTEDTDVIRVDTMLVINDVLVVNKYGEAVEGLTKNDFRIFEDESPQEISIFTRGSESSSIPRSIVLVIDHSSSQLAYLKNSIEAAKVLVRKLPANDRMAIVTDDIEMLASFTTDKDLLTRKLDELLEQTFENKVGKSKQYSALMAVLNEMFRGDDLRPIVIFQTDGDELMGLKRENSVPGAASFRFEDIVNAAEAGGVTIYSVIPSLSFVGLSGDVKRERAKADLQDGGKLLYQIRQMNYIIPKKGYSDRFLELWAEARARDEAAVAEIAKSTGGWHENLESPDQADEVYDRILEGINTRYMIGYYPTNAARDGRPRKITVRINNDPGYEIWGKKKYIAPLGYNPSQFQEKDP